MRPARSEEELGRDKEVEVVKREEAVFVEKKVVVRKDTLVRKWNSDVTKSYLILRKLGEGSFGEVFLVRHKQLKILRALKVVMKFDKPHANAVD
jgi:serine/threonine protein kinase